MPINKKSFFFLPLLLTSPSLGLKAEPEKSDSIATSPSSHGELMQPSFDPTMFGSTLTPPQSLTENSIRKFLKSNSTVHKEAITTAILELIESDPDIAYYVKIPFVYFSGFQIRSAKDQEFVGPGIPNGVSTFFQMLTKELALAEERLNGPIYKLISTLRHEFRHIALHAAQLMRDPTRHTSSTNNFDSQIPGEKNRIKKLFEKGNERINKIEQLLIKEAKDELNETQKKYLQELRTKFSDAFTESYTIELMTPESELDNTDVSVDDSFSSPLTSKQLSCKTSPEDPLVTLVIVIQEIKIAVNQYPASMQEFEFDAHLFQFIPPKLIQKFYPEYYQHQEKFLKDSLNKNSVDLNAADINKMLTEPQNFKAKNINIMLYTIKDYISSNQNLDDAKEGAELLIAKGFHVGAARLCLVEIAYLQGDYPAVIKNIHVANKKEKGTPNSLQLLYYIRALILNDNLELARTECKTVLTKAHHSWDWTQETIEDFAVLQQEIIKKLQAKKKNKDISSDDSKLPSTPTVKIG